MIIQSKADEGILTPGVDLAYGIVAPGPKGVKILNTDAVLRQYGPRYVCEPNSGRLYTFDGVAYVNVGMATIQADIYARARDEGLLVITATEWATISKRVLHALSPRSLACLVHDLHAILCQSLDPMPYRSREGVDPVIMPKAVLVTGDPRQLVEQAVGGAFL